MRRLILICAAGLVISNFNAAGALQISSWQGEESDLPCTYSSSDLIHGLLPTVLAGDRGWHPVNTDPADQLPAFTDGAGMRSTGLTGLLADFPPAGTPTKRVLYALTAPSDISEIRVFSGNNGRDGRVFHTYTVRFSSDQGGTFTEPIYVQSHPSGTFNNAQFNQWYAVLTQLTNDTGFVAARANQILFEFYGVDNSQGQMRDPFNGVNPFSGTDDGFNEPNTSSLIWEIDVLGQFSPPVLTASCSDGNLVLSWTTGLTNAVAIESSPSLAPGSWSPLNPQPRAQVSGATKTATVPMTGSVRFYRLMPE